MIYQEKPENFKPEFTALACLIKHEGDILIILGQDKNTPQRFPAGKIKSNENKLEAVQRIISEETGLKIPVNEIHFYKESYIRHEGTDFTYIMYHSTLIEKEPPKSLNNKGDIVKWEAMEEHVEFALVTDLDICISMFWCKEEIQL